MVIVISLSVVTDTVAGSEPLADTFFCFLLFAGFTPISIKESLVAQVDNQLAKFSRFDHIILIAEGLHHADAEITSDPQRAGVDPLDRWGDKRDGEFGGAVKLAD